MPTLVATVGGATSNAYALVATATTYFDERIGSTAWTNASADDQARALIMATRRLDQERYEGTKDDEDQALAWPRDGAFDPDGVEYDDATIPTVVIEAMYEEALAYLIVAEAGDNPIGVSGLEPFKSGKVGPLEFEKDTTYVAGQLSPQARRLLAPVIVSSNEVVRT